MDANCEAYVCRAKDKFRPTTKFSTFGYSVLVIQQYKHYPEIVF